MRAERASRIRWNAFNAGDRQFGQRSPSAFARNFAISPRRDRLVGAVVPAAAAGRDAGGGERLDRPVVQIGRRNIAERLPGRRADLQVIADDRSGEARQLAVVEEQDVEHELVGVVVHRVRQGRVGDVAAARVDDVAVARRQGLQLGAAGPEVVAVVDLEDDVDRSAQDGVGIAVAVVELHVVDEGSRRQVGRREEVRARSAGHGPPEFRRALERVGITRARARRKEFRRRDPVEDAILRPVGARRRVLRRLRPDGEGWHQSETKADQRERDRLRLHGFSSIRSGAGHGGRGQASWFVRREKRIR